MLSSSSAVAPSPAMSAAMASRRRPSAVGSAMNGTSSTTSTRMRPCYEPPHIVGVSETGPSGGLVSDGVGGEQVEVSALRAAERLDLPTRPAHALGDAEDPALQCALDP